MAAGERQTGRAELKRQLETLLAAEDFAAAWEEIGRLPPQAVRRQLLRLACRPEGLLRWRAIVALGRAVNDLAGRDLEAAREFVRRLLWGLNEESGAVGFGLPESLAEIMAVNDTLAAEYLPLFLSYLGPGENFLEFEPLQRGVLWGLGRLARRRPEGPIAVDLAPQLESFLASPDAQVRGLAAWAWTSLGRPSLFLQNLTDDPAEVWVYEHPSLTRTTVGALAKQALAAR